MAAVLETQTAGAGPGAARSRAARHGWVPYAFISPFYLLYGLFLIVPIGVGVYLSFTEWAGLGTPLWVGTQNYRELFADDSFRTAVVNTAIYVVFAVLIVVPAALLIAQALNTRGLRGRDLFRLTFFTPVVLSPIIIALVFTLFYDREYGLLNAALRGFFGTGGVDWLGDPTWAKVSVMLLVLWRWTGYLTIFFLAGLQNVPKELYEAARLDGAGALRTFFNITVPMLKPVTAFVAVTVIVGTAQIMEEPYLLTKGGPGEATLPVAMFIYREAFMRQHLGYAAAAGVVMFAIVFAIGRTATAVFGVGRQR
ncbi:sugar ABC transporter permease [Dactylosporangium aurantiacum]|uniref:Sugar ABC transporter permease n=1 Tax=Dactylosporangium aurantiacum TaxID=35754 RepID=A0A9Q9MN07_9ACTN|nr:sugar ABC transporter permease [Dactylosporangium aurantiacum]MDG6107655.1 sugar ABC transporter permease [Dactylosporangium aurantiacum]UWZ58751.1 sugar ABC transporter permease [Dactylosporangium aurantiacum]